MSNPLTANPDVLAAVRKYGMDPAGAEPDRREIGRASCRERV